jgi:hypothetical protein
MGRTHVLKHREDPLSSSLFLILSYSNRGQSEVRIDPLQLLLRLDCEGGFVGRVAEVDYVDWVGIAPAGGFALKRCVLCDWERYEREESGQRGKFSVLWMR